MKIFTGGEITHLKQSAVLSDKPHRQTDFCWHNHLHQHITDDSWLIMSTVNPSDLIWSIGPRPWTGSLQYSLPKHFTPLFISQISISLIFFSSRSLLLWVDRFIGDRVEKWMDCALSSFPTTSSFSTCSSFHPLYLLPQLLHQNACQSEETHRLIDFTPQVKKRKIQDIGSMCKFSRDCQG